MEGKTIVVGLTGQTGAGKTEVCRLLTANGCRVIDADIVARRVVEKGTRCLVDLALEFGIGILNADGTLNRRNLGSIVFSDRDKRLKLNRITFPYIQQEILAELQRLREKGEAAVFLDAPTLLESGTDAYCDRVVSVIAPLELRLERVLRRDGITREEALGRIRSQHGDEFYTSRSDFVIENSGDIASLRVQVMEMLDAVCSAAKRG